MNELRRYEKISPATWAVIMSGAPDYERGAPDTVLERWPNHQPRVHECGCRFERDHYLLCRFHHGVEVGVERVTSHIRLHFASVGPIDPEGETP